GAHQPPRTSGAHHPPRTSGAHHPPRASGTHHLPRSSGAHHPPPRASGAPPHPASATHHPPRSSGAHIKVGTPPPLPIAASLESGLPPQPQARPSASSAPDPPEMLLLDNPIQPARPPQGETMLEFPEDDELGIELPDALSIESDIDQHELLWDAPHQTGAAQQPLAEVRPSGQLDALIRRAIELEASDLHTYSGMPAFVRIAGAIHTLEEAPPVEQQTLTNDLRGLMMPLHWDRLNRQGEVNLCTPYNGGYRLRVNVYCASNGLCAVMRLIRPQVPDLRTLGFPQTVDNLVSFRQGLVVVAGPSNCGKTTTLAALVARLNQQRPLHIITVEEPIEYVHASQRSTVTQRSVGLHTRSYATALRAALREDPDVIVIGEMRDTETIGLALKAAETGHLVLATLHTWDVEGTIARILDAFEGEEEQIRGMLADALRGVLAQQLVQTTNRQQFPVMELLFNNGAVANCIRQRKLHQLQSLIHSGRQKQGMMTWEDTVRLLEQRRLLLPQHAQRVLDRLRGNTAPTV
ncbi:MAG: PilT/PilU family type 4a pilus ATPase, partial [Myxococcota bacterium]